MKCPLFNRVKLPYTDEFQYVVGDCLKEECAWWSVDDNACSVPMLALSLWDIAKILPGIRVRSIGDSKT